MKNIIIISIILFSQNTFANNLICKDITETSKQIMECRQYGIEIERVLSLVVKMSEMNKNIQNKKEYLKFMKGIINNAYREEIQLTEHLKIKIINSFSKQIYNNCILNNINY